MLLHLYALRVLERDLSWYLTEGLLTAQEAKNVLVVAKNICSRLPKQANNNNENDISVLLQLVESFGIPDHILQSPIALNWEKYNTYDNRGELDRFDPK
jgi:acyl-CoA oxidase